MAHVVASHLRVRRGCVDTCPCRRACWSRPSGATTAGPRRGWRCSTGSPCWCCTSGPAGRCRNVRDWRDCWCDWAAPTRPGPSCWTSSGAGGRVRAAHILDALSAEDLAACAVGIARMRFAAVAARPRDCRVGQRTARRLCRARRHTAGPARRRPDGARTATAFLTPDIAASGGGDRSRRHPGESPSAGRARTNRVGPAPRAARGLGVRAPERACRRARGFWWRPRGWPPCEATCGSRGTGGARRAGWRRPHTWPAWSTPPRRSAEQWIRQAALADAEYLLHAALGASRVLDAPSPSASGRAAGDVPVLAGPLDRGAAAGRRRQPCRWIPPVALARVWPRLELGDAAGAMADVHARWRQAGLPMRRSRGCGSTSPAAPSMR